MAQKTINAVKARQRLGQVIDEVFYKGDQFIIERAGKPMAAVVPVWQLEQLLERRESLLAKIDEVQERLKGFPTEELEAEIAEAVATAKEQELQALKAS